MPTRDLAPVGAPCWIDIFTSDPEGARTFYGELFGWTSEEPNPDMGGYFNFSKDGVLVAGGMHNDGTHQTPDRWSVHLRVEDAKATLDAAVELGSEVVVPAMDVADLGVMASVIDPGGALIGMWEPRAHKGFGVIDEPDAPGWFELHTRAHAATVKYYEDVFGWTTVKASDTDEFRYTLMVDGEQQLAGVMDDSIFPEEGNLPSQWHVYLKVADVDATLARVVELGGTILNEAEDTPFGRLAGALDPTGAMFKLTGPNVS
jgi:predicted enzyme related to lactoylglutathione lyase